MALDAAAIRGRPDIAAHMIAMFMRDAGAGIALGLDMIRTGDRTMLPRYTEQFLAKMDKLAKGEHPGGEIESLYRRGGTGMKVALSPLEFTGRILTALDYIGGQGIRNQQMLYASMLDPKHQKSFQAAMNQFNAKSILAARRQAVKELGPNSRYAQRLARAREILNQDIDIEIQKFGNRMTEVAALNAVPVGLSGTVYKNVIAPMPLWAKAPGGLAFAKAGLNLFQEYSNYMPITGQINAARALWKNPSPTNPFRHLSLGELPPARARQIVAAQAVGLALSGLAAYKVLAPQPEDAAGKPRKLEMSGSWSGLTPAQRSALLGAGEKPYAIKLPSGRWVDYKLTPYVGALAIVGSMRDRQRFGGEKYDEKTTANKLINAWLSGLMSLKDMSVSSQAAALAGFLASDTRELDEKTTEKRIVDALSSSAGGFIPMKSLLGEIDNYFDQQRYRPDRQNPGLDMWLRQVPFVRRLVGRGEDGKEHPMLNFLGEPVNVTVTPFNRHIGELPPTEPVAAALAEKVSAGMRVPSMSDDTTIVAKDGDQLVQRPMTPEENYFYQKSVRQGFKTQLGNDLDAFRGATPEQAALYAQRVFTEKERYVRDRMNTGALFDGMVPVDPKLTSALSGQYESVQKLNESETAPSAVAASKMRVAYDEIMAMEPAARAVRFKEILADNPAFGLKLAQYIVAPSHQRSALEKAEASLGAESRGAHFMDEFNALQTEGERRAYLAEKLRAGLISKDVLREMARQRQAQGP